MNDLMLNTAQELSNEQAGGHGDRWGVFAGGAETVINRLMTTIEKAELFDIGLVDKADTEAIVATGEPRCLLLLYTGQEKGMGRTGAMSLHVLNQAEQHLELWSAYPFFANGVEVTGVVDRLLLYPNRVEAVLEIGLDNGAVIPAFDPLFCLHRGLYRAGKPIGFPYLPWPTQWNQPRIVNTSSMILIRFDTSKQRMPGPRSTVNSQRKTRPPRLRHGNRKHPRIWNRFASTRVAWPCFGLPNSPTTLATWVRSFA